MTPPASPDQARALLEKVLTDGRLERIPRHPQRRDILLALLCVDFQRRYPYSEPGLNDVLIEGLATLNAEVDFVTCRRYMVDLGFLRRDRAGTRYFLNYPKLASTISNETVESAKQLISEALADARQRQDRRRERAAQMRGNQ